MKAAGTTAADRMKAKVATGKATAKKKAPNAKASKAIVMKTGKLKAKASPKTKASSLPKAKTLPQAKATKLNVKEVPKAQVRTAKSPKAKAKLQVMKTSKLKGKIRA